MNFLYEIFRNLTIEGFGEGMKKALAEWG